MGGPRHTSTWMKLARAAKSCATSGTVWATGPEEWLTRDSGVESTAHPGGGPRKRRRWSFGAAPGRRCWTRRPAAEPNDGSLTRP